MYVFPETYITAELAQRTKYKSIQNAYDRNQLSVIVRGSFWYVEGCTERVFATVKKEMKRLYPLLTFLYENDT